MNGCERYGCAAVTFFINFWGAIGIYSVIRARIDPNWSNTFSQSGDPFLLLLLGFLGGTIVTVFYWVLSKPETPPEEPEDQDDDGPDDDDDFDLKNLPRPPGIHASVK